jgi:sterol desaturase/sphingolipid hydroxylase (fatty acid hydroxylase superfamily)
MPEWLPEWVPWFALALFLGTLVEYWGHRLMHAWLLRKKHAEHHRDGWGQGWLGEFFDYVVGAVPILAIGFAALYWWVSLEAAIGLAGGGVAYACFAAYSHQLQHEQPDLCFWLRKPVHYLHHREHMWKNNFGISISLWDHVFRTYKHVEWRRAKPLWAYPLWRYFQIKWI